METVARPYLEGGDRCEEFTYSEDRLNVFASSNQRSKQFLVVLVLGLAVENR